MKSKILILTVCLAAAMILGWSALGTASSGEIQPAGKTAACRCDPCGCGECQCAKPSSCRCDDCGG